MDKKLTIPIDKLCADLPDEFKQLMIYSRTLEFEEKPDYAYLKSLFKNVLSREGIVMDYQYCWYKSG